MKAMEVFAGSDADVTKKFYASLSSRGPIGDVAVNLFRAQKSSARAKVYRGGIRGQGSFRRMAYDRKAWSMGELCKILAAHAGELGIRYGWKRDSRIIFGEMQSYVLYVDLPDLGQVSFHAPARGAGPDYEGTWDGQHASIDRILFFCDRVSEMPRAHNGQLFA